EFRFSRRLICKKLISRQFAFSRFRIENELTMPAWLTEQLALPEVSLVKGAYPVFFAENYIWVCIRVRSVD
ncbi:MAG: hypothetical protein KDD15_02510, partial [Lewinella sp.]|nr:hypothetical protein [Lewinella sp.]